MKIRLYNAYVITCNDNFDIYPNGEVWIEDDKIVYVGKSKVGFMADKVVNCMGDVVMPGFVNSHTHLPMQIFRGLAEDSDFKGWWYDNIRPLEDHITGHDMYWSTLLGIAEMVRGGTTCTLNNYFHQKSMLNAFEVSGMRGAIAIDVRYKLPKEERRNEWENRHASLDKGNPLVTFFVSSHSIFSVDEQGLNDCTALAKKYGLPQSIHLCETLNEVGNCVKEHGVTPVKYLEQLGFFDYPTTIAHGIHVDKEDIEILRKYDVKVSINMSSNLKLASGIAPIYTYIKNGVDLSLGTDSVASNNSLNMFKEMFLAASITKVVMKDAAAIPAKDIILMATRGGARALFLEDKIGQLTEGYQADVIRINTKEPHWQPVNDVITHLVYSASASDVVMTIVGGRVLYEKGSFYIGESYSNICDHCENNIKRLIQERDLAKKENL